MLKRAIALLAVAVCVARAETEALDATDEAEFELDTENIDWTQVEREAALPNSVLNVNPTWYASPSAYASALSSPYAWPSTLYAPYTPHAPSTLHAPPLAPETFHAWQMPPPIHFDALAHAGAIASPPLPSTSHHETASVPPLSADELRWLSPAQRANLYATEMRAKAATSDGALANVLPHNAAFVPPALAQLYGAPMYQQPLLI